MKKCSKCYFVKDNSEFNKRNKSKDGLTPKCKNCISIYNKTRYIYSKEELKLDSKLYYVENKEKVRKRQEEYNKKTRKIQSANMLNRLHTDNLFKLSFSLRQLIYNSLKKKKRNNIKKSKTYNILGCSFEEFKLYLESKFEPWMNWDNYGNQNGIAKEPNFSWDIDHIVPIKSAKTEEEVIKLNHYTNLQPLCSYINRWIKRGNLEPVSSSS